MAQIHPIRNFPIDSIAYIIFDKEKSNDCIVIDVGSKEVDEFINFFNENGLIPSYIILTHEHFDHVWGVNLLKERYGAKIICSQRCAEKLAEPQNYFNLLYFEDPTKFSIENIDYTTEELRDAFSWKGYDFHFYHTHGHTDASICISQGNNLFTGDTIMNGFKPVIKKKHGGSYDDLSKTLKYVFNTFSEETTVYPGHGEQFKLGDVYEFYREYM